MYDSTIGRWLSEDPIGLGPDPNLYRYVHNSPTNFTDPSGLAGKRRWINAPGGFRFGIDFGPELSATGGFEVHVYDSNGNEIAKLNGRGGWADRHRGKPLPCKPSDFKRMHPEAYKHLKSTMKAQRKLSARAGWNRTGQNLSCFMLAFTLGTIATVEEASGNENFKDIFRYLEAGNGPAAFDSENEFYLDLLTKHGSQAALNWRAAWHAAVKESKRASY